MRRGVGGISGAALVALIVLAAMSAAARPARSAAVDGGPRPRSETVEVWLAGRERGAQRFVDAVSTPGRPGYRRFLGPAAYSKRFGPRPAQVRAIRAYLTSAGFAGVHASVDGDYVSATAPAAVADQALSARAADRGPEIPSSLRRDILAVTGLAGARASAGNTAALARLPRSSPAPAACSRYWGQRTAAISPAFDGITRAAVPVCGYSADQIRGAYGLGSQRGGRTPTGTGETIALVQGIGAPYEMFRTLTRYAAANGLPAPRRGQYRQEAAGGSSRRSCDSQDDRSDEGALDSEAAYAMAPGADQLMVDGNGCLTGDDRNEALLDAELQPLTGRGSRPQAAIESVSYGFNSERDESPAVRRITHAIALRAAAEGVSLLFSSGDDPGVEPPADDPDVTAVGGTTLEVGAHGRRVFETGWSDGYATRRNDRGAWDSHGISFGAGGGVSEVWGEPAYQQSVVPTVLARDRAGTPGRAVPDLAADADSATGMRLGSINTPLKGGGAGTYTPFIGSGTSQATPLVAGLVADAEQGQPKRFGFLNPLLYSLAGSRAFHDLLPVSSQQPQIDRAAFSTVSPLPEIGGIGRVAPYLFLFDDQDPRDTDQVTAPGYDTMTGLGSPNGVPFLDALRAGR